jgi:hypothetical protein
MDGFVGVIATDILPNDGSLGSIATDILPMGTKNPPMEGHTCPGDTEIKGFRNYNCNKFTSDFILPH